jgi:cation transport ATPase
MNEPKKNDFLATIWQHKSTIIAALLLIAIAAHLILRFAFHFGSELYNIPQLVALIIGGLPMLYDLFLKLLKGEFGSDLLGGISIITSVILGEYLAGTIIGAERLAHRVSA